MSTEILISEIQLRQIIRNEILKEEFFDSKVKDINHVVFKGQKLLAFGTTTKLIKKKKTQVVVFSAPSAKLGNAIRAASGDILIEPTKVFNTGGSYKINPKIPKKIKNKDRKLIYYLPVNTKDLTVSSEKIDIGRSAGVDYAIELFAILGALPGVGVGFDIGGIFLALKRRPPDYFLAAISAICAIPALGIGAAFARQIFKKAGKEGTKAASREFVQILRKKGIDIKEAIIAGQKHLKDFFNALRGNTPQLEALARTLRMETSELAKGLDEVEEICQEIFKNMKLGTLVKAEREVLKQSVRRTVAKIVKDLNYGDLGKLAARYVDDLVDEIKEPQLKAADRLFRAAKVAAKKNISFSDMGLARDMLLEFPKAFVGKVFNVGGKSIVFKSVKQFDEALDTANKSLGLSDTKAILKSIDDLGKFVEQQYKNLGPEAEKVLIETIATPVSIESKTIIVKKLVESMKKVKFVSGRFERAKIDGKAMGGYMAQGGLMRINYDMYSKAGKLGELKQAIEHELIHHLDHQLIAILSLGDPIVKNILSGKAKTFGNIWQKYGSAILNKKFRKFAGKDFKTGKLKTSLYMQSRVKNSFHYLKGILPDGFDTLKEKAINSKTAVGFVNFVNMSLRKAIKEGKIPKGTEIPNVHLYVIYAVKQWDPNRGVSSNGLAYHLDPIEMLPRVQRVLTQIEKKLGKTNLTEGQIRRFFDDFDNQDILEATSADTFYDYFKLLFRSTLLDDQPAVRREFVDYFLSFTS